MKRIAILLICLIVFIAGCAPSGANGTTTTTASGTTTTTTSEEPEEPKEYSLIGQTQATQGSWSEMYLFKYVQEKFNMKFDITEISSTAWTERINIMFATNEYSDFYLNGLTETDRQTYGGQGIIIDLNEYITPENTPNIYEIYNKYPELRVGTQSYDGKLYYIGGYDKTNIREYAQARFFINKQWAENLGVKVPSTLDEFYEYLVAIRDGDADLDGNTDDEIPLGGSFDYDPFSVMIPVIAAHGYSLAFRFNDTYVDVIDDVVTYVPTEELFKNVLAFMNKLYEEELLDNEYFTQAKEQRDAKIASAKVGAFMDWAHWLRISDPEIYNQWDGVVPFTSEYNSTPIWPAHDVRILGQFVITDICEDPVDLLRVADWSFTREAYQIHLGGPILDENDDYEYGHYLEEIDDPSLGINPIRLNYVYPDEYASDHAWREALISPGWSSIPINRTEFTMIESDATQIALSDALNNNYTPHYKVGWPSSTKFSFSEIEELALIKADLNTYMLEMVSKFIVGEESLDNFQTYVDGCYSRGLERYIEIHQLAYDRRQ